MMSEEAGSREVGFMEEAEEMPGEEPAISEEEMLAMEEGMMQDQEPAAESAESMPIPEEMMAMEKAMAESDMSVPKEDVAPLTEGEAMGILERIQLVPIPMGVIDTSALEAHPLADLLPRMSDREFADLKESIELDGLQNPIILFQGMILDGRNRYRACRELGPPIVAVEFVGSEQQALTYVLSSNQHRRNLTPSQRAVVANETQPLIAEDVNSKRIEKIRQARLRASSGETLSILTGSGTETFSVVTSRAIAADMMGVSTGYVGHTKRIKEADPELYEDVRAGRITIPEALRKLDGITDDPETVRDKRARGGVTKLLRDPSKRAEFLDRLEALLAEFARR